MPEDAGSIYSSIFLKLDELQRGVLKVHSLLGDMTKKTQKQSSGFASFWRGAFQTAFGIGAVQIITKLTAAIKNAIGIFADFQQSMQNTRSVTDATNAEFESMTEKAKEMGETTRFTAREAADALYYLGSAGFSAQQSIAALDGVLQLAGATQSDLASTSEAVASIISQYNLQAEDAARISNVFAAAIGNSQATMDKLTNSFRQVGPVAAGFGYSVEETVGALQELYNAGFQGQQAGRALKSALADLASPTANLEKILTKYGIALNQVNPANMELADIITILGEKGLTTADIIDGFGKVAGPQMATLIKQGGDALRKYTADVTDTEAAAKAYEIQNDSLAGSLDFLRSKLEGTAIAIFEKLEPGIRDLIDGFIKFLDAIKPIGEILGNIFNVIFKIASVSTNLLTKAFEGIFSIFKNAKAPLTDAELALSSVKKSIDEAGDIQDTVNRLNALTNEYDKLTSKSKLSKDEQNRLRTVISEIERVVPNAATAFDEYGNAIVISSTKSREAARQMLETRKAIIEEAKARLEIEKPLLEFIIQENKDRAEALKKERRDISERAEQARQRLALIKEFNTKVQKEISRGSSQFAAYNKIIDEMGNRFERVGVTLNTFTTRDIYGFQTAIATLQRTTDESTETIGKLKDALTEETQIEIEVKEAEQKLKELVELGKQLSNVKKGLKEIDKIDPVDPNAAGEMDELSDKTNEFWNNYRKQIESATKEAELFGNKQDVLKASLDFLKSAYLELLEQGLEPTDDIMKKLRMEYDLTLLELNALIESEKKHTEELQNKEKIEQDIIDMTADYYGKIEELGKSENQLIEIERNRALASVYASGASQEAIEKAVEAINIYFDKLKQNSEETKEQVKITFDEMLSWAQQLADALIGLWQTVTQSRLDELDKQMQAEMEAAGVAEETERERLDREYKEAKKAGDKERMMEIENEIKRLEIKEKYEKEAAMIKYKAALQEWKLNLLLTWASFFQGIAKAVASAEWPRNLPAILFATAKGGLQVAGVKAQKPSPPEFETGGVFLGPGQQYSGSSGTPGTPAILHPREMVLNEGQIKNLFNAINSGNIGGSPASIPVSVSVILDSYIIGKIVEDMANGGQIQFEPSRALRKGRY